MHMSFLVGAREQLKAEAVDLEATLTREGYVARHLYREGSDPRELLMLHHLRTKREEGVEGLLDDEHLARRHKVLLIGNAGSGKTFTLTKGFLVACESFLQDQDVPAPFLIDLHVDLPSDLNIENALNHRYNGLFGRAVQDHAPGVALFLDSLDERLRDSPRFVRDVESFLREHSGRLAGCVVACRRRVWDPAWFRREPVQLEVYHVDYMDDHEYAEIIPDDETRQGFFEHCDDIGVSQLLRSPFDGFYMARRFTGGGKMPRSRNECMGERISGNLRGSAGDRGHGGAPPLARLRVLAQRAACLATFGEHSAWSAQALTDQLGSCSSDGPGLGVSYDEVETLLCRPLFSRKGRRFVFTHQLYREYLAAEAIAELPLRKQRQLLESALPLGQRVCPHVRGVATALAEMSSRFADHLVDHDPVVAFFAESPSLDEQARERLVKSVIDQAVADHIPPWWELPPRGERFDHFLTRYRPDDVVRFLEPYLQCTDEMARIWGAECAEAWGGAPQLNTVLSRLAHDVYQHEQIRTSAIEAVAKAGDIEAIRDLYGLFEDQSDRVRGYVLSAYRSVESPRPRAYLSKLRGGSRVENLTCRLQFDVYDFCATLDHDGLVEAFQATQEMFESLRDLRSIVLGALFKRAASIGYTDVPADLVLRLWEGPGLRSAYYDDELDELLHNTEVARRVWVCALETLAREDSELHPWRLAQHLAPYVGEWCVDLIAQTGLGVTEDQRRFLTQTVHSYFNREPTPERLARLQEAAPDFSAYLAVPVEKPDLSKMRGDPLQERWALVAALKREGHDPVRQTAAVLAAIGHLEHPKDDRLASAEDVCHVLDRMPDFLRPRALRVFRQCLSAVHYERRAVSGRKRFTVTRLEFETPFRVLLHYGERVAPEKTAEVITCYGLPYSDEEVGRRYTDALRDVRTADREAWERCVMRMLEESIGSVHSLVEHLIEVGDAVYVKRCGERLSRGLFELVEFSPLLDYWQACRPNTYQETLRDVYELLRERLRATREGRQREDQVATAEQRAPIDGPTASAVSVGPCVLPDLEKFRLWDEFRPLFLLMGDDDDWAWDEFALRLSHEDVPLEADRFDLDVLSVLGKAGRLPVLADWYALIRRRLTDNHARPHDLAQIVLSAIISIGGMAAIDELRRLQRERAFPKAQWLSHAIVQIEDGMLAESRQTLEGKEVLDFVNAPESGLVKTERDLFEWVCQAIEDVKEALENRAEGVAGFWDMDKPKRETDCQNVLWPRLRERLHRLAIADVEEKLIGRDQCDFWVEMPQPNGPALRVAVELKTCRKGYARSRLVDPIDDQLWEQYLRPSGCRHGVYVALWFRDGKRYDWPALWCDPGELEMELSGKCEEVGRAHDVRLTPYVIDLTAPIRK